MKVKIKGVRATRYFSLFLLFREKPQKILFLAVTKYVDFSCKNELDMFKNNEFRRFCNDFTALSEKNLIFSVFVSATRDIIQYFIKLKKKLHTENL